MHGPGFPHLPEERRWPFDRLSADWPLVPMWAELLADIATPVSLFPAVAGDGPGILLESVERSERWGRYSFVAGDPAAIMVVDEGGLHLRDVVRELPTGEPSRRLTPREALRAAVHRLRAPRVDGLPPITGGLMGYAAYEAATLLDGHPVPHPDEAPCPPIGFLLIDRAVVFDHWRQRLVLVTHVPAGRYDDGIHALEELAGKLAGAFRTGQVDSPRPGIRRLAVGPPFALVPDEDDSAGRLLSRAG